ncbi:hypothetical protein JHW43_005133 [Diplocarpon mali]|nr:hypothetical protein JHW43_005133 [Diplocarpon mali]
MRKKYHESSVANLPPLCHGDCLRRVASQMNCIPGAFATEAQFRPRPPLGPLTVAHLTGHWQKQRVDPASGGVDGGEPSIPESWLAVSGGDMRAGEKGLREEPARCRRQPRRMTSLAGGKSSGRAARAPSDGSEA